MINQRKIGIAGDSLHDPKKALEEGEKSNSTSYGHVPRIKGLYLIAEIELLLLRDG